MSNPTTATPDTVVEAYVATWNETDPARRRAGIDVAWAEAGVYRDPVMASDGPDGIDAMLAGVQAKFSGVRAQAYLEGRPSWRTRGRLPALYLVAWTRGGAVGH